MIKSGYASVNEASKFNAMTPNNKLAAEARRLVDKAKKSNDSKDAWAVVDFLYDFPNALCESIDTDLVNESVYYVSGSTPTGEGDSNITNSGKITDPAKAIEQWFKIGAKHRTGTAITATKKSDAIALVTWADKNQDKITEWHKKYGCPYKLDFLLKAISDQVRRKCSSFYEGEYGDMVYPFDVG